MKFKKAKSSLLLLSSVVFVVGAQAQTHKFLNLTEAIQLGVNNSKTLKQNDASIAIAKASLQELKNKRLPSASVSGSYLRVSKPTMAILFSTGNTSGPTNQPPQVTEAMYALGNASYTLFDGFQNSSAIKSAQYQQNATQQDAAAEKQQVIQQIITAYCNLYKAHHSVDLVKENLNQAHQRTLDFEHLEKNGLVARNDLLKVKLQESNIQLSLLDAESEWHIANLSLDLLLGLPQESELSIDSNSFVANNDIQNLSYWEQLALSNRPDFKAIEWRKKAAQSNIKVARGAYYPSLTLTGGYVALNVPNALRLSNAWNGGLGLRYNISSLWKTGAEINMAKARLQQTEAAQEMLDDKIRIQLYESYESYILSQKKIDVLDIAVQQANENYKIINNKYKNSLATTTDLLEADVQQLQARLNYSYAKADALLAYNKLLQTAGMLNN